MTGVESLRVHGSTDYVSSTGHVIRWTELFFVSQALHNQASSSNEVLTPEDPADGSRLADQLAQAFCLALTPHLDALTFIKLMKIGLRVSVGVDQVRWLWPIVGFLKITAGSGCDVGDFLLFEVLFKLSVLV